MYVCMYVNLCADTLYTIGFEPKTCKKFAKKNNDKINKLSRISRGGENVSSRLITVIIFDLLCRKYL